MRHRTIWVLTALIAYALAVPALADDTAQKTKAKAKPSNKAGLFDRADSNKDGRLTFDEVSAVAPKFTKDRFDKLDQNADGSVTKEEFAAMRQKSQGAGSRLMAADANNDGKLTLEEITTKAPKYPAQRFTQLDANKDGFLTSDELPKPAAPAAAAPSTPPPSTPADGANKFKQADADKNGEVSFAEAQSAIPGFTQDQFNRLDKNRDGVITPDETPRAGAGVGAPPKGEPILQLAKRADTDQNGKVTYDEMKKVATGMTQERFNQLDTNKDGVLSMEDRQQGGKPGKGDPAARANAIRKLLAADSNSDGKVTLDEAQAAKPGYPKEAFDKFDTNKDGVISAEDQPVAK